MTENSLKNVQIARTCFSYRGGMFYVDGYYFIYKTSDGKEISIPVEKSKANAISGRGLCGVIVGLSEIKILNEVTNFADTEIRNAEKEFIDWANESEHTRKYGFLKDIPPGLSNDEVSALLKKRVIDGAVRTAMKERDEHIVTVNLLKKKLRGGKMPALKSITKMFTFFGIPYTMCDGAVLSVRGEGFYMNPNDSTYSSLTKIYAEVILRVMREAGLQEAQ